jgi:hypothetical protein
MAQLQFTLTQEEYEALIALAREGTKNDAGQVDHDLAVRLDAFLRSIEKNNGVERDAVWVQWQELDEPLPAGTRFPEEWPPKMRVYIELIGRKVAEADVRDVLRQNATNPTSEMVTSDPGAMYGWTPLDDYFT